VDWTYLLLAVSAFFAGAVNAIAGGGTLLTFPVLLTVLGPVSANATSTFALLSSSLSAAWAFRNELSDASAMLKRLWLPSLVGGICGSLAVTRFPEKVFESLVPWLLLGASVLLVLQKPIARWAQIHPHTQPTTGTMWGTIIFQFFVGVYGGYFGAGIGILMLTSLAFLGLPNIHTMNALKAVLGFLMNAIATTIFIVSGAVVWKYGLVMAAAALAGGYAGAKFSKSLSPATVRAIVITIGFGVAGFSFYRRFVAK
jgi:uncharacterized protein